MNRGFISQKKGKNKVESYFKHPSERLWASLMNHWKRICLRFDSQDTV